MGDFYEYTLILLVIIIILLLSIAVSASRQASRSKELEDAVYRLIEITKENAKTEDRLKQ